MPQFDWRPFLSAASAALPVVAETRASRRQFNELQRGKADAAARQREADARISDELSSLEQSNPDELQAQSLADYTVALQQARGRNNPSQPAGAALGDRQAQAAAGADRRVSDYGQRFAEYLSKIDAPTEQRRQEQQSQSRAGIDVRGMGRDAEMDRFLAQLRARQQRANPWAALLGRIGSNIANNFEFEDEGMPGVMPGASASSTMSRLPVAGRRQA